MDTGFPQAAPPADAAARIEAFQERFATLLNEAAAALMISIGHRAGLFDTMAGLPPASSQAIAEAARLDERYVREWLGAMTTARIVTYEPQTGRYALPPEHAACLTRDAAPNNLAPFAQYVGVMGTVEDDVIACFRNGGGVPYARYRRFHELMAEDSGQTVLPALIEHILPLAPGLAARLDAGIDVLDAGCGRGQALLLMAQTYPNSRFVGYDLSYEAIAYAAADAERRGLTNVRFDARDLSSFDVDSEPGAFDLVTTFDAVHDQAKPGAVLAGIARTLAPGGVYIAQDIDASSHVHNNLGHALGTFLYTISCMHCMTVSLAQGGDGLGTMWGREQAEALMRAAGFASVEVHNLLHDPQNCYYVCRP